MTEATKENGSDSKEAAHLEAGSSSKSVDELERRIHELEAQLKEKEGKYLYLYAEFENFKKRIVKEKADHLKFGWEPLAHDLLQVIDNLERAVTHAPASTDSALLNGLNMVLSMFRTTLQKQGLQDIPAMEKNFDPEFHEAVGEEASDRPKGTVMKEHVRGYTLHGRLLRPSRVTVSSGKEEKR